jgi:hypothetical protein
MVAGKSRLVPGRHSGRSCAMLTTRAKVRRISAAVVLAVAAMAVLGACESRIAGVPIPLRAAPAGTTAPSTATVVQPPETIYIQPPTTSAVSTKPADTPEGRTVIAYYDALNRADFAAAACPVKAAIQPTCAASPRPFWTS